MLPENNQKQANNINTFPVDNPNLNLTPNPVVSSPVTAPEKANPNNTHKSYKNLVIILIIAIIVILLVGSVLVYFLVTKSNTKTSPRHSNLILPFKSAQSSQINNNAVTDFWSGGGNSNNNWSDPANWTKGIPRSGDNLVFNLPKSIAANVGQITTNNDLKNISLNNIKFTGGAQTGATNITITGNPIYLSAGINNQTVGSTLVTINNTIDLESNQTFGPKGINFLGAVNTANYSLGLYGYYTFNTGLIGAGRLTINNSGNLYFNANANSSSFNGTFNILKNASLNINNSSSLGTANINISYGGMLEIGASGNMTIDNNITMLGVGNVDQSSNSYQGAISTLVTSGISSASITLTGNIAIYGNTELGLIPGPSPSSVTYNFSIPVTYNGYTLTKVSSSNVTINISNQ